jgi:hypothetical protein
MLACPASFFTILNKRRNDSGKAGMTNPALGADVNSLKE